jgi:hypothetical protein
MPLLSHSTGEGGVMTKRECPLLVLSPQARSADQVRRFKPFGSRTLVDIIRRVSAAVPQRKHRRSERHVIFAGFFFGTTTIDEASIRDLHRVPSSLVDCRMYSSAEASAAAAAQQALSCFAEAPAGSKFIVLTCNDGCLSEMPLPHDRARSEEALYAHLWLDLCGGAFRRIGKVMARRWGD